MPMLVVDLLLHVVLGLGLAALVWAVGAGWVAGRGDPLDGYPVGLLAVTTVAFAYLLTPWLGLVALALLVPALRVRPAIPNPRVVAAAAGPVVALPIVLGLIFHGPTQQLASAVNGETLWWANRVWSASASIVPYHDLLAEGQRIIYVEGAPSYIGGALSWLPRFDTILFHTTSLPAFLLVSAIAGTRLVARGRRAAYAPLLAFVALASVVYPTFPTESPPVALALPLAFLVYRLWEEEAPFARLVLLSALTAAGLLLTKVIALLPFAVVVVFVLYDRYWHRLGARRRAVIGGAATAAVLLVVVTLFLTASWYRTLFEPHFLPARAASDLWGELTTRNSAKLAPTFQIVGESLLLAALIRARALTFAAALAVSVAPSWFLTGQGFYMAVGFSLLFAALFFAFRPAELRAQRSLLAASAVAIGLWQWTQDITGIRVSLVLLAIGWLAFVVALERRPPLRAYGAAACVALAAWAAGGFRLETRFDSLTPRDRDIWRRVHALVPGDGLVFTSLTGQRVTLHQGWNNYASAGMRQLYIAGWYDGRLVAEDAERNRRLASNAAVLGGRLRPTDLGLSRFRSYWAVLRDDERVPESFRRVYGNAEYTLYRIES